MSNAGFDKAEAVRYGWSEVKKHAGMFVLFLLVVFVLDFAVMRVLSFLLPGFLERPAIWLAHTAIFMSLIWLGLRVYDGRDPAWNQIYSSGERLGNYIATQFLFCIILAGGLLLLVIPGIIWAIRFGFAGFLAVDRGLGPVDALRSSHRMTKGHAEELFFLWLILIGINFLGILCAVVGIFVTIPLSIMAATSAYRALLGESDATGEVIPPAAQG